jgi:hypothetical protein
VNPANSPLNSASSIVPTCSKNASDSAPLNVPENVTRA